MIRCNHLCSLIERCVGGFRLIFFVAILSACTQKNAANEPEPPSDNLQDHIVRLTQHFETSGDFKYGKWALGAIYFENNRPIVQVRLPVDLSQYINQLRAQKSIKTLCPIAGRDDYWKHPSAKSFLIYLMGENNNKAKAMIFCTKAFNEAEYNKLKNPSLYPTAMLALPPDNVDVEKIDAQLSMGTPSYRDAQKALEDDNITVLQNYLLERPELVDMYTSRGTTLLFDADNVNEIYVLIAFGANPNVKSADDISVLEWAARVEQNISQVKKLIDFGAEAKFATPDYVGSAELARLFLKNGAAISEDSLQNALHDYKLGAAEVLYEHGARFNKTAYSYPEYLHEAVRYCFYDNDFIFKAKFKTAEAYVKYLDDLNLKDDQGLTALDIATHGPEFFGKKQIIDLLVSHGAKESGLNQMPKKPIELLH